MPKRIKDHLWFIQFSLWRGLAVFLLVKLTLSAALDIAVYAVIFQAGSRTSVFLPITYWMQHHGLSAFRILMIRPGSSIGYAINAMALFASSACVAWCVLGWLSKSTPVSNTVLSE